MSETEKKEIGQNANKIWSVLNDTVTGISIQELCNVLRLTFQEVTLAIRWLARDHNIGLDYRDKGLILIGVQAEN